MLLNCALLIPHVLKVDYNCEIVFLEETWISTYLKIYCIVYNVTDDQPMTKIYSVILDIVDDARCNHSFIFPFWRPWLWPRHGRGNLSYVNFKRRLFARRIIRVSGRKCQPFFSFAFRQFFGLKTSFHFLLLFFFFLFVLRVRELTNLTTRRLNVVANWTRSHSPKSLHQGFASSNWLSEESTWFFFLVRTWSPLPSIYLFSILSVCILTLSSKTT
jgi:hypothetical protein